MADFQLTASCPTCGNTIKDTWDYCPECGRKVFNLRKLRDAMERARASIVYRHYSRMNRMLPQMATFAFDMAIRADAHRGYLGYAEMEPDYRGLPESFAHLAEAEVTAEEIFTAVAKIYDAVKEGKKFSVTVFDSPAEGD